MKDIFSAVEKVPELAKGFSVAAEELAVSKELPPNLPTEISPVMEKLAKHAGQRVNWKQSRSS